MKWAAGARQGRSYGGRRAIKTSGMRRERRVSAWRARGRGVQFKSFD